MSGWTVITVRGRYGENYENSEYDDRDRWQATADIAATMEEDDRIHEWTTWSDHVYAVLNASRYDWIAAEEILRDYWRMIDDAVVLGANDTTDTGTARYYPDPDREHTDEYQETQKEDGCHVGEIALAVMTARHGIVARDPFHNECGFIKQHYLDAGNVQHV